MNLVEIQTTDRVLEGPSWLKKWSRYISALNNKSLQVSERIFLSINMLSSEHNDDDF